MLSTSSEKARYVEINTLINKFIDFLRRIFLRVSKNLSKNTDEHKINLQSRHDCTNIIRFAHYVQIHLSNS